LLGGVAGAVVATVYWIALGVLWLWGAICELIGVGVGAALGAVAGDGSVKEAWAGRVGAFLIPLGIDLTGIPRVDRVITECAANFSGRLS
jgi:hypothetical protein